jgi:hypothetical protein
MHTSTWNIILRKILNSASGTLVKHINIEIFF